MCAFFTMDIRSFKRIVRCLTCNICAKTELWDIVWFPDRSIRILIISHIRDQTTKDGVLYSLVSCLDNSLHLSLYLQSGFQTMDSRTRFCITCHACHCQCQQVVNTWSFMQRKYCTDCWYKTLLKTEAFDLNKSVSPRFCWLWLFLPFQRPWVWTERSFKFP